MLVIHVELMRHYIFGEVHDVGYAHILDAELQIGLKYCTCACNLVCANFNMNMNTSKVNGYLFVNISDRNIVDTCFWATLSFG